MKPRWSVSGDVLAAFHRSGARERQQLLDLFNRIAEFPANSADYYDRGPTGRTYSVAQIKNWIVTYWVDPDGNEVRIVQLEFVI